MEIDLHGMDVAGARDELTRLLSSVGKHVAEIRVVHGQGTGALRNMVRKGLSHPRIKQKILSMNPGETILLLKE
jgi:DNA-nicking Smr family endonuclease